VAASATRLAVMPFAVRGSGEHDYLQEGLVDLRSTKLDGAGDLKTVESLALLSAIDPSGPVNLSPAAARAMGERFGAGLVVMSNVVEAGQRLPPNATLYDFRRGGAAREAAAESEAGELFELVDSVAA
jgi:TolB-like protein